MYLTQAAPLHGVHGALYGYSDEYGVHVVNTRKASLPYGHPQLQSFLASQWVRQLKTFQLITLDELLDALDAAAVRAA
ncbi:hypothetical protein [Streptomyces sp. MUSC 14]|uniref:hypothetical protein n=1 Tax=Streptomyces sp. MUSC 14 TaxID=1354889 RepID=UPI001160DD2E|nr:hypothetical protein [Streptomyces sp. MUSC 14]